MRRKIDSKKVHFPCLGERLAPGGWVDCFCISKLLPLVYVGTAFDSLVAQNLPTAPLPLRVFWRTGP